MVGRHAVPPEHLAKFPRLAGSFEALMEQSDTPSIHALLLTPQTRGMILRAMLECMPKGGAVVNTARGPVVHVEALAKLLKRGHLAGIGLGVLLVEPPVEPIPKLPRAYRLREPWCESSPVRVGMPRSKEPPATEVQHRRHSAFPSSLICFSELCCVRAYQANSRLSAAATRACAATAASTSGAMPKKPWIMPG